MCKEKEPSNAGNVEREIIFNLLRIAVCPDCDGSGAIQEPIGEHFVTREMAMDAGEPSMEGSSMGVECETRQCQWCYEREVVLSEHATESDSGSGSAESEESGSLPCGCSTKPNDTGFASVFWNPGNQVVQCHRCGQVYTPSVSPAAAEEQKGKHNG